MDILKEFQEKVLEVADEYAKECVFNPEEHQDAVESIVADFVEGAHWAYGFLLSKKNG